MNSAATECEQFAEPEAVIRRQIAEYSRLAAFGRLGHARHRSASSGSRKGWLSSSPATRGALATTLGACAIFGTANAGDVGGRARGGPGRPRRGAPGGGRG